MPTRRRRHTCARGACSRGYAVVRSRKRISPLTRGCMDEVRPTRCLVRGGFGDWWWLVLVCLLFLSNITVTKIKSRARPNGRTHEKRSGVRDYRISRWSRHTTLTTSRAPAMSKLLLNLHEQNVVNEPLRSVLASYLPRQHAARRSAEARTSSARRQRTSAAHVVSIRSAAWPKEARVPRVRAKMSAARRRRARIASASTGGRAGVP